MYKKSLLFLCLAMFLTNSCPIICDPNLASGLDLPVGPNSKVLLSKIWDSVVEQHPYIAMLAVSATVFLMLYEGNTQVKTKVRYLLGLPNKEDKGIRRMSVRMPLRRTPRTPEYYRKMLESMELSEENMQE